MNALISVIIPAHNAAVFLPDAVESVRAQGYSPIEIIVVDDGSRDDTAALAESLGVDRVVRRSAQSSPSAARNAGYAVSTGDWLLFLDADDTLPPGTLTAYAAHIDTDQDIGIVGGFVHMVTLGGVDSSAAHAPTMQRNMPFINVHLGAALIRRSVMEQVGTFDEALVSAEDVDWYLRVEESGVRRVLLRRSTLFYRRHTGNITQTQGRAVLHNDFLIALRRAFERRGNPVDERDFPRWKHLLVPISDPPARLSVIIPPGTRGTIAKALAEVAAQTRLTDEVVVIAPSRDAVAAIVPDALRDRLCVVESPISDASIIAEGVRAASGDVVAFLRPGDRWMPDYLERMSAALDAHPEVEYLVASRMVEETGLVSVRVNAQPASLLAGLVVRRRLFETLGGFDARYTWAYDDDWFVRAQDAAVPYAMLNVVLAMAMAVPAEHVPAYMRELLMVRAASMRRRAHERKYLT